MITTSLPYSIMARPRIFISSTYYDLKHLRSSLDVFVSSLGFEPILSEKGDIAYSHDIPLDESCYREVETADIFVLLIGGRYGAEASGSGQKKSAHNFSERYDSITRKEFESALRKDVPIYILVETNVYSEYHTFLRNKSNDAIAYAHVDSVNVFHLIEEILAKPRNNPTHTFSRFSDIESWLRDQWSGLFRELLNRKSQQQQLTTLSLQVGELKETNNTLRKYLEAVMSGITPRDSTDLIESEKQRLAEIERREKFALNPWGRWLLTLDIPIEAAAKATQSAKSYQEVLDILSKLDVKDNTINTIRDIIISNIDAQKDFNKARMILGSAPLSLGVSDTGATIHQSKRPANPPANNIKAT